MIWPRLAWRTVFINSAKMFSPANAAARSESNAASALEARSAQARRRRELRVPHRDVLERGHRLRRSFLREQCASEPERRIRPVRCVFDRATVRGLGDLGTPGRELDPSDLE